MNITEWLEQRRGLEAKATKGIWWAELGEGVWSILSNIGTVSFFCAYGRGQGHPELIEEAKANAELITVFRNDYAALLDVVEAASKWDQIDAVSGEGFLIDIRDALRKLVKT